MNVENEADVRKDIKNGIYIGKDVSVDRNNEGKDVERLVAGPEPEDDEGIDVRRSVAGSEGEGDGKSRASRMLDGCIVLQLEPGTIVSFIIFRFWTSNKTFHIVSFIISINRNIFSYIDTILDIFTDICFVFNIRVSRAPFTRLNSNLIPI